GTRGRCSTYHRCGERIRSCMLHDRLDDASHQRALRGGEVRIGGGLRMPTDDDPAPRPGAPRARPAAAARAATEDLLRRYRRRRSVLLRNLLVERPRAVVEAMARRPPPAPPPAVGRPDPRDPGL